MSKINVLDSAIFNRIAAGEVVENPRSIVKELVENSIDAGADSVTVEIRGGGIEYIAVTDNGKGIGREDMPIAFMPHATSKIRSLQDLEAITTLGFRGEALPSIASVADVEMVSRTPENELAYRIALKDGKITDEGEYGAPFGTKVTVRNLFEHIPARAKFLRKPQMEESTITEFLSKIILANPSLKIKYIADGETVYQSDGNGMKAAVHSVYGNDFLQRLEEVSYSLPDIQLHGLIGRPDFTKHNRTYQALIVNGRYIVNADIAYCIQQCYATYLMKRQFPVYILYLDLPPDMVDVNVHPNKLDVRFSGEKRLKGILYNYIKEQVDRLAQTPQFSPVFTAVPQPSPQIAPQQIRETAAVVPPKPSAPTFAERSAHVAEPTVVCSKLDSFVRNIEFTPSVQPSQQEKNTSRLFETKQTQPDIAENTVLFFNEPQTKYCGKLFNTYLLIECGNNFYIIDQHAAHEKLLYDKLLRQIDEGETAVQDLLIPYIFDVSPTEKVKLTERLPEINACGFKVDPLSGNSFSLYALPVCCADIDLKRFVSFLLDDITSKLPSAYMKENLMQAACKSAVKGEEDLSQNEIDCLIEQLRQSGATKFCPHGRPTVIQCAKSDLEKLFKRI